PAAHRVVPRPPPPPAPHPRLPYPTLFRSSRVSALCCAPCRTTGHNDAQPQAVLGADPTGGLVAELVAVFAIRAGLEGARPRCDRSEEHTSELQSRFDLVCRLVLARSTPYA